VIIIHEAHVATIVALVELAFGVTVMLVVPLVTLAV